MEIDIHKKIDNKNMVSLPNSWMEISLNVMGLHVMTIKFMHIAVQVLCWKEM